MIKGKPKYISSSFECKLPYKLTDGVTATLDGLIGDVERIGRFLDITPDREFEPPIIDWLDVAERLSYRDGDPYVSITKAEDDEWVMWCETLTPNVAGKEYALNRIAAILCDDGGAFRVLHWCINNLARRL